MKRRRGLVKSLLIIILLLFFLAGHLCAGPTSSREKFFGKEGSSPSPSPTVAVSPSPTKDGVEKTSPTPPPSKESVKKDEKPAGKKVENVRLPSKAPKGELASEGQNFIYRITWNDQLVGYSKFFVSRKMKLAGDEFYKVESVSELKIGMGKVEHLVFGAQMTVKKDGLYPTFFRCAQRYGDVRLSLECLFSNNLVAQQNNSPSGISNSIVNLGEGQKPFVFMNNLWGRLDTLVEHYWIIVKSGHTGKFTAYDPVLQYIGTMNLEKGEAEEIQIAGRKVKAVKYTMYDFGKNPVFTIWADKYRNVLRVVDSSGIKFELSSRRVIADLKKNPGVDLWQNRVSRSDVFIPNAREINWMKADISFSGRGLESFDVDSPGFQQKFEGSSSDGVISGVINVRTKKAAVKNPPSFPVKTDFPEDVIPYTKEAIGIESTDDDIKNRALEASWKSKDVWEAAQKINLWVANNIPRGIALPSAKMTLTNEQGNSESKALLAIAMCRSVGIPARKAGGIVFSGGNFIPHHWFEVYTGKSGWAPLDPSSAEAGNFGATHVRLYTDGEIWNLKVNVKDFSPKPPSRITYINRELTWPVGEERVYVIKKGDRVIGREKAVMEEVGVVDDRETYKMNLTSKLSIQGVKTVINGVYWMTPQGLPFKYQKQMKRRSRKASMSLKAEKGFILQQTGKGEGQRELKIPYSRGAYLVDTHFLCQWAIIGGQFKDPTLGKVYNFGIYIPEIFSQEKIRAQVRKFEAAEAGEKIYDSFRIETNKNVVFWQDSKSGKIVKIKFVSQNVTLELVSSKLKI